MSLQARKTLRARALSVAQDAISEIDAAAPSHLAADIIASTGEDIPESILATAIYQLRSWTVARGRRCNHDWVQDPLVPLRDWCIRCGEQRA